MAPARSAPVQIDLTHTLTPLRTHITDSLCQTVFATVRATERQRVCPVEALFGGVGGQTNLLNGRVSYGLIGVSDQLYGPYFTDGAINLRDFLGGL